MDNAAWYAWNDMTPWRFAILIGVVVATWIVIKLVERYGTAIESHEEFFEDLERTRKNICYSEHPGNVYHHSLHND